MGGQSRLLGHARKQERFCCWSRDVSCTVSAVSGLGSHGCVPALPPMCSVTWATPLLWKMKPLRARTEDSIKLILLLTHGLPDVSKSYFPCFSEMVALMKAPTAVPASSVSSTPSYCIFFSTGHMLNTWPHASRSRGVELSHTGALKGQAPYPSSGVKVKEELPQDSRPPGTLKEEPASWGVFEGSSKG